MWLVTGPFDGEVVGELGFQKTKLLKTNRSYPLGRKERPLTVSSKKVSHDHCEFIVGEYSQDDVGNPSAIPTLEFVNKKDKAMRIVRDGDPEGNSQLSVNPSTTQELRSGDVISIVTGILITVQWTPVCCYSPTVRGKSFFSTEACASLGINIVPTPNAQVTHHLTSTFIANSVFVASLLSACQFVKPEWLHELIRLGNLPINSDSSSGISLEQSFALPASNKYRPAFSSTLPPSQKVFKVWEPNEERLNLLNGHRYLCVGEKAREIDSDLREVITRGGGSIETFDVHAGKVKWRKALTRGQAKEGKKLVLVGDVKSIQAATGSEGWNDLVVEAETFGLRFCSPDKVVQAVLDIDTSILESNVTQDVDMNNGARSSSPLPDFVPNSLPEEPSLPPNEPEREVRRPTKLIRRATSRQASQTPVPEIMAPQVNEGDELPAQPRKGLIRRVMSGKPVVTGLDDPSSILDATPDLSVAAEPPSTSTAARLPAPTPGRPKLKRRVGVATEDDNVESRTFSSVLDEPSAEPPLKKFKALFEASHPDRASTGSFGESPIDVIQSATLSGSGAEGTQTQTQTQNRGGIPTHRRLAAGLGIVQEEEEETQSRSGYLDNHDDRGTKRKAGSLDEDIEMAGVEEALKADTEPATKKRAVESVNAVERRTETGPTKIRAGTKPPSTKPDHSGKQGSAVGKPDTDAAFLKAIASTKRGKKSEDTFDREFNNLKISKPDLVHEEPEKDWALLGDFGDETNVRGNFMMVLEMEVFKPKDKISQTRDGEVNSQWRGKPDFKKFKKKNGTLRRAKIELVANEENDYGIGAAYWQGTNVEAESQGEFATTRKPIQKKKNAPKHSGTGRAFIVDESDDDDEMEAPRIKKHSSRAGSMAAPKQISTRAKAAKPPAKAQPLFIDSDDDIESEDFEQSQAQDDEDLTLASSAESKLPTTTKRGSTRPPAKAKKAAPIIVDDDSDDDAVFKGFKGRRKGR